MDIAKLQAILQNQKIRVGDDDPLFSMVALNEAILKELINDVGTLISAASIPTLKAVRSLEAKLGDVPRFAEKEMQSAASSQREALAQELICVTRELVGDAITAKRAESLFLAGVMIGGIAVLMFGAGIVVSGYAGWGILGITSAGIILGGFIGVIGTKFVMEKTETERMAKRNQDAYLNSTHGKNWLRERAAFNEKIRKSLE